MTESRVYADSYSRKFSDLRQFLSFLTEREQNSRWVMSSSKKLEFEPIEKDSPMGNLYMQIYDSNGKAEILEDTMENTSLLMRVNGETIPVRSCAIKTVLERARISGNALSKVSKAVFAEILNYCMGVASGDSLVKIADAKVSAVHGGDPRDYAVMEMLPLFQKVSDYVTREFPGSHFVTAHFDHQMATAIWCLDGQADKLLDTYRREVAAKGLDPHKIMPALRFSTSDVGMSGANLYPIFLNGNLDRIIPLGYPIKTEHKCQADLNYFEGQLDLIFARFRDAIDRQIDLLNIEVQHPGTTLMGVLKKNGVGKRASYETLETFEAIHGDAPCTAYELFLQMSDVIFAAQCDGASGMRIAQLEEIIARAIHVNWREYDRPGDFKW